MKNHILIFLALAVAAFAQQGQMASSYTASGTAGAGYIQLANQSTAPSTPTSAGRLYFDTSNLFSWKNTGGFIGKIDLGGAARTITLSGNPTLADWFDQSVKTSASPTFVGGTFSGNVLVTGAGALQYGLTRGSVTSVWQSGSAQSYFGNSSNHPVELIVNNASVASLSSTGLAVTGISTNEYSGASGNAIRNASDTSGTSFYAFNKASGSTIGSITRVTTTDAVAYNTTSDARLKQNVRDFTAQDSGPIIDGLKPRWFDWKSGTTNDSKNVVGLIAQEEASVDPVIVRIGAVSVGDSALELDPNNPESRQWQRSDQALVPILIAELKGLRARMAALEAKVAQLSADHP